MNRNLILALLALTCSSCLRQTDRTAVSAAQTADSRLVGNASIRLSWNANREAAVNRAGGGYHVYYYRVAGQALSKAQVFDVPYSSGPTSPTSAMIPGVASGTWYAKVAAYSSVRGPAGASQSAPSSEVTVHAR